MAIYKLKLKYIFTFIITGLLFQAALAVPKSSLNKSSMNSAIDDELIMALSMPIKNRVQALKNNPHKTYSRLKKIVFEDGQSISVRWRAMTTLGVMYKDKALPLIIKGLNSKEWFLRNSALIALKYCEKGVAIKKSVSMLTDKALVVRTAAVQNLNTLNAVNAKSQLWEQISNPINFRKGKSLWVRLHMAKLLVKFANSTDKVKFTQLLKDKEASIRVVATQGLEKSYGLRLGNKGESRNKKIALWRAWLQKNMYSIAY